MGFNYKALAQVTPANTNVTNFYELPVGYKALFRQIHISNTGAGACDARIFLDRDNNTADETTAIYYDVSVPAGDTNIIQNMFVPLLDENGAMRVRTNTANDLTFTLYGCEYLQEDLPRTPLEFGQVRPSGVATPVNMTGPNGLRPITAGYRGIVTDIFVTNTHAVNNATAIIYHDIDGETFNDASVIWNGDVFKADFYHLENLSIPLDQVGALAVESDIADAVTFSVYGYLEPFRSL